MKIETKSFGALPGGQNAQMFRAVGRGGLEVTASDYGATLVSVRFPDKDGITGEITLGFDGIDGYLGNHPYFGATVGRYANRISNASFVLDGKRYELPKNIGSHHLHGGVVGFNRVLWDGRFDVIESVDSNDSKAIISFRYRSVDGEEGYPGTLDVTASYVVGDDNTLGILFDATSDAPTPINLTNHTYWNIDAPGRNVFDHILTLHSDARLFVDEDYMPDGRIIPVDNTPYDFRKPKTIGEDFEEAGGYDTNYIVRGGDGTLRETAVVESPRSGRTMSVATTQAAIQLYTTNMMDDIDGRDGTIFHRFGALCLESGCYNNAVNISTFPTSILRPGERYAHSTIHTFGVRSPG